MDTVEKISHELARVEEGKLKAFADKDRVMLVIQDAPMELRKLADALEKINVREIQALVAYQAPGRALPEKTDGEKDASPSLSPRSKSGSKPRK